METRLKKRIFTAIFTSILLLLIANGCQFRQGQYNFTELELTDREHVLLNALHGARNHSYLFEISEGTYEIKVYHYQFGFLEYERTILEEYEISEVNNLLAVVSVVDEGRVLLNLSTSEVSTIDLIEFELEPEGSMSVSEAISRDFDSIPSAEQVFTGFIFASVEELQVITTANISELGEFDETVDFLSNYDNVVLFTARRID